MTDIHAIIISDDWNRLAKLSRKWGGLIPGPSVRLVARGEGFVLTAGWKAWLGPLFVLCCGLFFLLPLILGLLIIPGHPRVVETYLSAIFGVYCLWLGFRTLRVGKISWHPKEPKITITHGGIVEQRTVAIPTKGVTAQLYMYKADRKGTRLRYGDFVLSLTRSGQEEEILLARVKSESEASRAYQKILNHLSGEDDQQTIKHNLLQSQSSSNIVKGEWGELAARTRDKRPFLPPTDWRKTELSNLVVVNLSWRWRVIGAVFLAVGVLVFAPGFITFSPNLFDAIPSLFVMGLGGAIATAGYMAIVSSKKIAWNPWGGSIRVTYGYCHSRRSWPLPREICRFAYIGVMPPQPRDRRRWGRRSLLLKKTEMN